MDPHAGATAVLQEDDTASWKVDGSLTLDLRARRIPGESDLDAVALLAVRGGDRNRDRFTVDFLARGAADLDRDDGPYFADITDSYSSSLTGQVYEAALSIHWTAGMERIRLGRQTLVETPVVALFDGVLLEAPALGSWFLAPMVYAGVPVHQYESSSSGDFLGGAALESRPWTGGRWRLDWMSVQDDYLGQDETQDVWGFHAWQALGSAGELQAGTTFLDGDPWRWEVRQRWWLPGDGNLSLDYAELDQRQSSQTVEFDPFSRSAWDLVEYREMRATVHQPLGERWDLDVGADARWLQDSDDEGPFNREFEHYYVNPTWYVTSDRALALSVMWDAWNSSDDHITTLGGDLEYAYSQKVRLEAGSSYALYKVDLFGTEERDHVRSWYLGLRLQPTPRWRVRILSEYEVDDEVEALVGKVAVTWTF